MQEGIVAHSLGGGGICHRIERFWNKRHARISLYVLCVGFVLVQLSSFWPLYANEEFRCNAH
jgi:hypothetical protein